MLQGVPGRSRGRSSSIPKLVIGGGLDRQVPVESSERLAEWLGAEYEPFGAHSHYGLVSASRATSRSPRRSAGFLEVEPALRLAGGPVMAPAGLRWYHPGPVAASPSDPGAAFV